jgi:hypothetical protein|tara:strand:+ start:10180 stop:10299 length:120 start_codon:yes stop_codon:yes gene_type:complete
MTEKIDYHELLKKLRQELILNESEKYPLQFIERLNIDIS